MNSFLYTVIIGAITILLLSIFIWLNVLIKGFFVFIGLGIVLCWAIGDLTLLIFKDAKFITTLKGKFNVKTTR